MKVPFALSVVSLFWWLFASTNVAAQQVFKCTNAAGKIEFSDAPCHGSRTVEKVRAQANTLDLSGSRELQLRKDIEQLREQLKDQQQKAIPTGALAPQRMQPDLQAERIDTLACERARRDYEVTASSTSNSQTIVEAKRSIMYGTCGMREPNKNSITIENRINTTIR